MQDVCAEEKRDEMEMGEGCVREKMQFMDFAKECRAGGECL